MEILLSAPSSPVNAVRGSAPASQAASDLININTAPLAELDTLPGIGPVLAQAIREQSDEERRSWNIVLTKSGEKTDTLVWPEVLASTYRCFGMYLDDADLESLDRILLELPSAYAHRYGQTDDAAPSTD